MNWEMLAALAAIMLVPNGIIIFMMNKLHNDIQSVSKDSNDKWVAVNARVDATQAIIMRMLEKRGM